MQLTSVTARATATPQRPAPKPAPEAPHDKVELSTGQKIWTAANHVADVAQTGLLGGVTAVLGSVGNPGALLVGGVAPAMLAVSGEFRQRPDWKSELATVTATSVGGALLGAYCPPAVAMPAAFALGAGLETARKLITGC